MECWQSQDNMHPMPLVFVGLLPTTDPAESTSGSFGEGVLIPEPFLRRADRCSEFPSSQITWPETGPTVLSPP